MLPLYHLSTLYIPCISSKYYLRLSCNSPVFYPCVIYIYSSFTLYFTPVSNMGAVYFPCIFFSNIINIYSISIQYHPCLSCISVYLTPASSIYTLYLLFIMPPILSMNILYFPCYCLLSFLPISNTSVL